LAQPENRSEERFLQSEEAVLAGRSAVQNGGTACHSEEWRFTDEEPLPNRRRSGRISRSGWRKRAVEVQPGGAAFKDRGVVVKWRGTGFDAGAAGFANGTAFSKWGLRAKNLERRRPAAVRILA